MQNNNPRMSDINQSAFKLSLRMFRHGISSFQGNPREELFNKLSKIMWNALQMLSGFSLILMLQNFMLIYWSFFNLLDVLLISCIFFELIAVRRRSVFLIILSEMVQILCLATFFYTLFRQVEKIYNNDFDENLVIAFLLVINIFAIFTIILRLIFTIILFKTIKALNAQFKSSNTIFLQPNNIPVTFSSILTPEELDPTNPYHPRTVYNSNKFNKSVA